MEPQGEAAFSPRSRWGTGQNAARSQVSGLTATSSDHTYLPSSGLQLEKWLSSVGWPSKQWPPASLCLSNRKCSGTRPIKTATSLPIGSFVVKKQKELETFHSLHFILRISFPSSTHNRCGVQQRMLPYRISTIVIQGLNHLKPNSMKWYFISLNSQKESVKKTWKNNTPLKHYHVCVPLHYYFWS